MRLYIQSAVIGFAAVTLAACATAPQTKTPETTMAEATPPAAEAVATTEQQADASETICKRQTVVGSNFKKKICATRAEWDLAEKNAREATSAIQRGSRPTGSGN